MNEMIEMIKESRIRHSFEWQIRKLELLNAPHD